MLLMTEWCLHFRKSRALMEYKSKFEPPNDVLSAIPPEEDVLWKGRPSFWGLSWHNFGIKWISIYMMILLLVLVARLGVADTQSAFKQDFFPFFTSGVIAGVFLLVLSAIQVYHTVYVVTEKRIIIKNGAALAFMISVPFKKIVAVNLQKRLGDLGTISFELSSDRRVPYISCWPSVRPWLFKRPQPAFSCVSRVENVGGMIKDSMVGGSSPNFETSKPKGFHSKLKQSV